MKRILICFVLIICFFGIVSIAYGNSGSAVIPNYVSYGTHYHSAFHFSNITDDPITVKVTFFRKNGTLFIDDGTQGGGNIIALNVSNYNENVTNATASFTLNGKSTGNIEISNSSTSENGFGIIEWTQDSYVEHGLVAYGYFTYVLNGDTSRYAIVIHNGEPF